LSPKQIHTYEVLAPAICKRLEEAIVEHEAVLEVAMRNWLVEPIVKIELK
jgi:hypothetical protein